MITRKSTLIEFLTRHDVPFAVRGDDLMIACRENPRHDAAWNVFNGWLSCLPCQKVWGHSTAIKLLSNLHQQSLRSSASEHMGWRGLSNGILRPWSIPQWAEEFHMQLNGNESLKAKLKAALGLGQNAIDMFHIGWSPPDFLPEGKWTYSNCFTLPVAPLKGSWCAIYFFGMRLLAKNDFSRMRVLGNPVPFWTLNYPSAKKVIETAHPIEAIQKAMEHANQFQRENIVFIPR